jgi:hypothetical protein
MHHYILAWATFVVQVVTLIVLCFYAWDTNRMKNEMLRNGTASRRPFLTIESESNDGFADALLTNLGQGLALNTTWRFVAHEQVKSVLGSSPSGAIAVNMRTPMLWKNDQTSDTVKLMPRLIDKQGIRIDYEDTAGNRYWSIVKRVEGFLMTDTGGTS